MLVMVFIAVFAAIFAGLTNLLLFQGKVQTDKENQGRAFEVAESGLNYYRWHLAHFPTDLQNGTGHAGPYEVEYLDTEGRAVGKYSLEIDGNMQCGQVGAVDISSTGWTYDNPNLKKTVIARYARPSVAKYAYIFDTNVWMGGTESVSGKFFSNGGIRMDAMNDSTVSSKLPTWKCTSSLGCSPSATKPGVFGAGHGNALWVYPAPWIDFSGIASNFDDLRTFAQNSGLYFGLSSAEGNCHSNHGQGNGYAYGNCNQMGNGNGHQNDGDLGWHITFKNDGTIDVSRIKKTTKVWGYEPSGTWTQDGYIVKTETAPVNFEIPSQCSVIFAEDDVWIDGDISGKRTLVVANIDAAPGKQRDVVLRDSLRYVHTDGTDGLTVISQRNIAMPLDSPDILTLNGIFVAQGGAIGRKYYFYYAGDSKSVPVQYKNYVKRTRFDLYGSMVVKTDGVTEWVNGTTCVSGYCADTNAYDADLADDPPPMTPYTSVDYLLLNWNESK